MKLTNNILKYFTTLVFAVFHYSSFAQNLFIENKGQFPKQVISKTILPGGALYMEKGSFTYAFYDQEAQANIHDGITQNRTINAHAYRIIFENINSDIRFLLDKESHFFENYYLGNIANWAEQVKSFNHQYQNNIYNGIDLHLFVQNDQLKYELIVAPYANVRQIKLKYYGVEDLVLANNQLLIKTSVNDIIELKPYAYQLIKGKEVEVDCKYKLKKKKLYFEFPNGYNKNYSLIIDPTLVFSTYSGSTSDNFGYTATYDNFGFLYSGSTSFSMGYPTTIGAYQINYANPNGGTDIAITKYDTSGTVRMYSTYLGGDLDELPHSMIVNNTNELFIFGTTASENYPTTSTAYSTNFNGGSTFSPQGIGVSFPNGSDIIVSRLSANGGNLLASTYLGGSGNDGLNTATKLKYNYADEVRGEIDIDKNNNIYIATCTNSLDFPIFGGVFQPLKTDSLQEGCIVKMDNQLTNILWSSYLGGSNDDAIYSLALDNEDNIYVTGGTNSSNFPTTNFSFQPTYLDTSSADAFVALIESDGSQIISSTYFGSNLYDQSYFVELGKDNNVYLFGQTKAIGNTLVNNAPYFQTGAGQFISVLSKDLSSLVRSTVVGTGKGTPDISPTAFLVDVCNKIYISGWGSNLSTGLSTLNLPITSNAFQTNTDGNDFYLMVLDDAMNNIMYATYFGGSQSKEHVDGGTSRFDKKGIIYQSVCAGCGGNNDFPIEPNPGAVSITNNSTNCNNGVFKFNFDFPMIIADFDAPWVGCSTTLNFQNLSTTPGSTNFQWDFGDGNISTQIHPAHQYNQSGLHTVQLIATSPASCNITDTISKQIYILSNSSGTIPSLSKCKEDQIQIGLLPINDPAISYFWVPSNALSSVNVSNPFANCSTSTQYTLLISDGTCTDTLTQWVYVNDIYVDGGEDTAYCATPIQLVANYSSSVNNILWSSTADFSDTLSQTIQYVSNGIGKYYISVTDGYCYAIDSVEILTENINIQLSALSPICIGDTLFVKADNLIPLSPIITYNWFADSLMYNTDSSAIWDNPPNTKWYTVEVINIDGCILKDSIIVEVYPYPIIEKLWANAIIIYKGEEINTHIQTDGSINWQNTIHADSIYTITPEESTWIGVEVTNNYGCITKDSIYILVKNVFCNEDSIIIPTAFSPNEDNKNDKYFIIDKGEIIIKESFRLEIFNRLGQKVFYTDDISMGWNGTYKGKKLAPQVFDFYLNIECVGNKELFKKGNITLIR